MKALSIKQPWASLIAHGIKDIENRTWKTSYRGRIYIHASGKPSFRNLTLNLSQDQMDALILYSHYNPNYSIPLDTRDKTYPYAAIIGEVDIVDCVINHLSIWAEKTEMPAGVYMGEKPIYNWVLANAVLYDEPILNVKGKLSLWDYIDPNFECGYCDNLVNEYPEFEYGDYGKVCANCFSGLTG
ncbi:ASCH domain-containing protein [Sphingobacterium corticis]|uniref:ASCH domain-containing protein n=1 Tax=Sphingobacterium corticis TaxID=1812823 RepID=A0ABW5NP33_9SPHI